MIYPKDVERVLNSVNALPPPLEIVLAHPAPVVERNSPVLAPLLGELVVLEVRLRRRTAGPIECEFVRPGKHIGAVIADAERNVAHQRNTSLFRISLDVPPLLMGDPLHISKKFLASRVRALPRFRQSADPFTGAID